MAILATLKRSIGLLGKQPCDEDPDQGSLSKLSRLPDEILEAIAISLGSKDLRSLRLTCKRLAVVTTHLLIPYCAPDRNCTNGTESLRCLIYGSRLPLLNGTIISLTLSASSWKSPLAFYGKGLREFHLLRLTSLYLNKIRIGAGKDLEHLLDSHAPTLRQLHLNSVHLPDLRSWRSLLIHISRMDRLRALELCQLFYTSALIRKRETYFLLPRSTSVSKQKIDQEKTTNLSTATTPQEIGLLIDGFFTDSGELQQDFGELLLVKEQGGWMRTVRRNLGYEESRT